MSPRGEGSGIPGALWLRWRTIAACGLAGMFLGLVWGIADVPRYSASSSVVFAADRGGTASPDPAELERFAELGASARVATVAAGLLGGDVAGADLLSDISVRPSPEGGGLRIQATAEMPDFAAAAADGYAEALVKVGGKRLDLAAAASIPSSPSENRPAPLWAVIGLAAGLLAGALITVASRPRRRAPIAERPTAPWPLPADAFGAPLLAGFGDPDELIAHDDDGVLVGREAIGSLRSVADGLALEEPDAPRTLAVLGASPGDGAGPVATGLSIAAAELGLRVLLVEADLPAPALAARLGVAASPGLRDYLSGEAGPREVLRSFRADAGSPEPIPLVCVPAGEHSPESPGHVAGPRFEGLVERLSRVYDLVVFTAPPLLVDEDAEAVARAVEGLVLVCADDADASSRIRECLDLLKPGSLIGGVLTGSAATQATPQARR